MCEEKYENRRYGDVMGKGDYIVAVIASVMGLICSVLCLIRLSCGYRKEIDPAVTKKGKGYSAVYIAKDSSEGLPFWASALLSAVGFFGAEYIRRKYNNK